MPLSQNNRKVLKKKPLAKKPWTDAPSKPSATSATKAKKSAIPFDVGLKKLKKYYPDAHCALDANNPFELTAATILSAQCTDERVNKVTPFLFAKYPDAKSLAAAQLSDVEEIVKTTGFFRNKAKNLIGMAQALMDRHGGEVPQDLESMVQLPGVGRKTANVVLGNSFGIISGVVVDTHVGRLSQRLGWTRHEDPVKIEKDLMKNIPKEDWIMISHYLIFHGRKYCKARNPDCPNCFLFDLCPQRKVK